MFKRIGIILALFFTLFSVIPALASVPDTTFENTYTTDGSTVVYSFTWRLIDPTQMIVQLNGTTQSTSEYTVFQNSNGIGGTVTFNSAPGSGETLLIERDSDLLQNDQLLNNQALPPATLQSMFDKATIQIQQLQNEINNLPLVSKIIAGDNTTITSTGPDGTGDVTINSTGGGGGGGDITTSGWPATWQPTVTGNNLALPTSIPASAFDQSGASTGQTFVYNGGWGVGPVGIPFGGLGISGSATNPTTHLYHTYQYTNCTFSGTQTIAPGITIMCTGTFDQTGGSITENEAAGDDQGVGGGAAAGGDPSTMYGMNGAGNGGTGGPLHCGGGGGGSIYNVGGQGAGGGYPSGVTGPGTSSGNLLSPLGSGGAGGGDATNIGGQGGDSGQKLTILAQGAITINGAINNNGANGGTPSAGVCGGGGGGSGGLTTLASGTSITITGWPNGIITEMGGAGGNAVGANAGGGGNGAAGGLIIYSPNNVYTNTQGTSYLLQAGTPGTSNGSFGPAGYGPSGSGGPNCEPFDIVGPPTQPVITQIDKDLPMWTTLMAARRNVFDLKSQGAIRMTGKQIIDCVCSLDAKDQADFEQLCFDDQEGQAVGQVAETGNVVRLGTADNVQALANAG